MNRSDFETERSSQRRNPNAGFLPCLARSQAPEFPLFFGGQSIRLSALDDPDATSWLVYRLTGSGCFWDLSVSPGKYRRFCLLLCRRVGGSAKPRHVLVITQTLAMLQSFGLAVLTLAKVITIREILALSVFQGLITPSTCRADRPSWCKWSRIGKIGNAIAINSSMVNMARLLGPALGGIVIAGFGEGYCFLIDGISYLASSPRSDDAVEHCRVKREATSMLEQLKEGWPMFQDSPQFEPSCCSLRSLA